MNRKLTHMLVGIVTATLVLAAVLFSLGATAHGRSTGGARAAWPALPRIAHPVKARMAECGRCHGSGKYAAPRNHRFYDAGTCLTCHRVAPPVKGRVVEGHEEGEAGPVTHPVTAPYDDCVGCHAIGENLSMPEDHGDYANGECGDCHSVALPPDSK